MMFLLDYNDRAIRNVCTEIAKFKEKRKKNTEESKMIQAMCNVYRKNEKSYKQKK